MKKSINKKNKKLIEFQIGSLDKFTTRNIKNICNKNLDENLTDK